jgi:hypothetical protein
MSFENHLQKHRRASSLILEEWRISIIASVMSATVSATFAVLTYAFDSASFVPAATSLWTCLISMMLLLDSFKLRRKYAESSILEIMES